MGKYETRNTTNAFGMIFGLRESEVEDLKGNIGRSGGWNQEEADRNARNNCDIAGSKNRDYTPRYSSGNESRRSRGSRSGSGRKSRGGGKGSSGGSKGGGGGIIVIGLALAWVFGAFDGKKNNDDSKKPAQETQIVSKDNTRRIPLREVQLERIIPEFVKNIEGIEKRILGNNSIYAPSPLYEYKPHASRESGGRAVQRPKPLGGVSRNVLQGVPIVKKQEYSGKKDLEVNLKREPEKKLLRGNPADVVVQDLSVDQRDKYIRECFGDSRVNNRVVYGGRVIGDAVFFTGVSDDLFRGESGRTNEAKRFYSLQEKRYLKVLGISRMNNVVGVLLDDNNHYMSSDGGSTWKSIKIPQYLFLNSLCKHL